MPNENIINSSEAPEPVGLYPHARRVGNLLFLSGVGPREKGTKKIPGVELRCERRDRFLRHRSAVPFGFQKREIDSGIRRFILGKNC